MGLLAPISRWKVSPGRVRWPTSPLCGVLKGTSMPNHHPSRSWRGCAMCKPHKRKGAGRAVKDPVAVVRKLGKRKRLSRRYLGDAT
jgi:hypothetical protein